MKIVKPQELFTKSKKLAQRIYKEGFVPDLILTVWRGGSVPSICIDELYQNKNIYPLNIILKVKSYNNQLQNNYVQITENKELIKEIGKIKNILIVDDVFDTGKSLESIIKYLHSLSNTQLTIKIATIFYKPSNNKTKIVPDYFESVTNMWIKFPHETTPTK